MASQNRLLPTTPNGWFALLGASTAIISSIVGSMFGTYAWLMSTIQASHAAMREADLVVIQELIEETHDARMDIEHRRTQILADIVLLDKAVSRTPEGDDRDAFLARRVELYAELDEINAAAD